MQFFRLIGSCLKWSFILVVSATFITLGFLSLPSGKKAFINVLNPYLKTQHVSVQIAAIDHFFPLQMQVKEIVFYSLNKAAWLRVNHLNVTMKLSKLFSSRTLTAHLLAKHIAVEGLPETEAHAQGRASAPGQLEDLRQQLADFQLPINLNITLDLNKVDIAQQIAGQRLQLAVHQAAFTWQRPTREFQLKMPISCTPVLAKAPSAHNDLYLTVEAAGLLPHFHATLQGAATHFILNKTTLEQIKLQAAFQGLPFAPTGTFTGGFHHNKTAGFIQVDSMQTDQEVLTIKGLHFKGLNAEILSDLTYNFVTNTLQSNWKASSTNLEPFATFFGYPLQGSATLRGECDINGDKTIQTHFILQAHNLKHQDFTLETVAIKANLQGLLTSPTGEMTVHATKLSAANFDIARADGSMSLQQGQGNLKLYASGTDLKLDSLITLNLTQMQQQLTFQKLFILYQKQPIHLMQPVNLIWSSDKIELSPTKIQVVSFPIKLSGTMQGNAIEGKMSGQVDLGLISKLLLYSGDIIDGKAILNLNLSGTTEKPLFSGRVQLRNGSYENIIWGTLLKGIHIDLKAQGSKLVLENAVATDGHGGRATLKGHYDFESDHLAMTLDMAKLRLAYTDQIQLIISQSHLVARGSLYNIQLKGRATLDSGRYDITKIFLGQIETLNVTNPIPMNLNKPRIPQAHDRQFAMTFNVDVEIPPVVKIYGRGLDSLWRGALKVTETLENPLLVGSLKLEKGSVKFLGQGLQFKDGLITFDGNSENIPFVDMNAVMEQSDFKANVSISGRASKPQFLLSSTPSLPQDEIIARLLFGRTSDKLSPFELVSLAKAVADFQSGRTSQSLLGTISDTLGLDTLGLKTEEEDSGLQVGKRFSDKVHVRFDQGIKPEDSKAILEVEPTKNITVTTEIGATTNSGGLGIHYNYNY